MADFLAEHLEGLKGLLLLATGLVSFVLARHLSKRWRTRRQLKERAAREAAESRQVRRARQRRGR